jgi:hypothetical protein
MAAGQQLNEQKRLSAFSFGITAYETVSSMVRPVFEDPDATKAKLHIMTASHSLSHDLVKTVSEAREAFRQDLPRTAYVIGESASRFCRNYEDYALSGASVARELEINAFS